MDVEQARMHASDALDDLETIQTLRDKYKTQALSSVNQNLDCVKSHLERILEVLTDGK